MTAQINLNRLDLRSSVQFLPYLKYLHLPTLIKPTHLHCFPWFLHFNHYVHMAFGVSENKKSRKNPALSNWAPPTEYTSNELLEDLQRIYRLKAIINDYGNKAVRDIQNCSIKGLKKGERKV